MSHQRIFQIDGADPFAAGFHKVLLAVDNLDVALFIHVGDIAGAKPSVGGPTVRLVGSVVIASGNPWTTNFEFTGSLSVAGSHDRFLAVLIFGIFGTHDAKLDERHGEPLLPANFVEVFLVVVVHVRFDERSGRRAETFRSCPTRA